MKAAPSSSAADALLQTSFYAARYSVKGISPTSRPTFTKAGQFGGDAYDGIYAYGLVRFDRLGVGIVPLWRAMMQATEVKGEVCTR